MGEARRRQEAGRVTTLSLLQACDEAAYKASRMCAEEWAKTDNDFIIKLRGMFHTTRQMVDEVADLYAKKGGAECSRGCFFCCRQMVSMSPPELFIIAWEIMSTFTPEQYTSFIERLNAYVKIYVDPKALAGKWCPLLINNECSIYDKRPIACRVHQSVSRQKCETTDMFGGKVPYIGNTRVAGMSIRMAVEYVLLRERGVRIEPVELTHGLLIVLQDFQSVFDAWASGSQDVFTEAEERDSVDDITYTDLVLTAGKTFRNK